MEHLPSCVRRNETALYEGHAGTRPILVRGRRLVVTSAPGRPAPLPDGRTQPVRILLTRRAYCVYSVYGHARRSRHLPDRRPADVPPDRGADQASGRRRRLAAGRGDPLDPPARGGPAGQRDHRQARLLRARAGGRDHDPAGQGIDRRRRARARPQPLGAGLGAAPRPGRPARRSPRPVERGARLPAARGGRGSRKKGKGGFMTDSAVHFEGVSKTYRHFTLDDVHFELPAGSIMGFIGANGAGKSTTLRILLGLVHQDRGSVRVLGSDMPAGQIAVKREVGFASEDLRLYKAATLAWHMDFVRSIYPSWDEAYAASLARRFDLEPEQKIKGLSHGQRVKAALLLVLARRPRLLVLDEPTTGLDPVARSEVLGALMEVLADDRRTVLFSSQNTLDVEQISDLITFIDRGRIVDSDDKESFLDRWRRVRLDVPEGVALPALPGIVASRRSGRLAVLTTNRYDPNVAAAYRDAGATVDAVDTMTLEEIFVADVQSRREGKAA